mmetsp:Transcript_18813/g.71217  ORF Transcript_18813/g.71217 Transcript_18813/m.71217 type:complete len:270 (+) Transcript_18813:779-1588(+)
MARRCRCRYRSGLQGKPRSAPRGSLAPALQQRVFQRGLLTAYSQRRHLRLQPHLLRSTQEKPIRVIDIGLKAQSPQNLLLPLHYSSFKLVVVRVQADEIRQLLLFFLLLRRVFPLHRMSLFARGVALALLGATLAQLQQSVDHVHAISKPARHLAHFPGQKEERGRQKMRALFVCGAHDKVAGLKIAVVQRQRGGARLAGESQAIARLCEQSGEPQPMHALNGGFALAQTALSARSGRHCRHGGGWGLGHRAGRIARQPSSASLTVCEA